jgi:hypothetical protein
VSCPRCASTQAELDEARRQLAEERAAVNALRMALASPGSPSTVPGYPVGEGLPPPPLRYQAVDWANAQAKRALGPLHRTARALLARRPR